MRDSQRRIPRIEKVVHLWVSLQHSSQYKLFDNQIGIYQEIEVTPGTRKSKGSTLNPARSRNGVINDPKQQST